MGFFFCACPCDAEVEQDGGCFDSYLFDSLPAGSASHAFAGSSEAPTFVATGGRLDLSNGSPVADGSWYTEQDRVNSFGSGDIIEIEATVYSIGGADKTGIFIGGSRAFYADWGGGVLAREDVDADGDSTSAQTTFSTVVTGDTLKLRIAFTGASTANLTYYKNGVSVATQAAAAVTTPTDPFKAGAWAFQGGQWDNMTIRCLTAGCSTCASAPETWRMTVAGVTDGTCASCDTAVTGFNGTFDLIYNTGCTWLSAETRSPCSAAGGNRWTLDRAGAPLKFRLYPDGSTTMALYELLAADFDCLGENVLTLVSNDGTCATWPATITIAPD